MLTPADDPAIPRPPLTLLDVPMHPWTMAETMTVIAHRLEAGQFTQHVVVNVAKLVSMGRDPTLAAAVTGCHIINIDGMGVVWGGRLLGLPIPERVAGIDLFQNLLGLAEERGWPVYFLGARQEVVERTVAVALERHPDLRVAGWHHGYFWDREEAMVAEIRQAGAKLLFVAISSPRKEDFINRWRERLGVGFVMGVGGSFDVMAGVSRRAPVWMQRMGLEWLYRVMQEPGRMWRRYLVTNTLFLGLLLKERLRRKKA